MCRGIGEECVARMRRMWSYNNRIYRTNSERWGASALTRAGMFPGKTLAGARARAGIAAGPRRVSARFLP